MTLLGTLWRGSGDSSLGPTLSLDEVLDIVRTLQESHPFHRQATRSLPPTGGERVRGKGQYVGAERMAQIYGRTRKSWYLKINPVWWFMNDDEQTVDQADWYHPEWPYWRRWLYWNVFRNPLQNFRAYIVGVSDKNYWVRGREPVMTVQRNDLVPPEYGYQWCALYGGELWVPRLFLSYSGKSVVWYVGHQPSGLWGVKFNLPHAGATIVAALLA